VLTAFRDNEEKVAAAVAECRRLGIEVRPPDVHRSFVEFTVEDDAIRFGLLAVKNVGEGAIESIIAARRPAATSARWPTSAPASTCGSSTSGSWSRSSRSGR
jgi:DNA polymerase III alpha subunit